MKKILFIILVLVLCLSLCACGVDKKYTALLEHLDTGNYPEAKTELTLLSPDFQAEQEKMAADSEILAKYADLIALLEAEDYESAAANVLARIPVPEEPAYTEIAITMDNWTEYFETVYKEDWIINGFDEAEGLNIYYALQVKEEYVDRLTNLMETKVDIEFSSKAVYYNCEYDFSQMTYTKTSVNPNVQGMQEGIQTDTSDLNMIVNHSPVLVSGSLIPEWNVVGIPEDFQVLRIQGSICLLDE